MSKYPHTKGHISEKWVSAFPQESCHFTAAEQLKSISPFGHSVCLRTTKMTERHKWQLIKILEDLEHPQRPTQVVNYHLPKDIFLHEKKCRVTSLVMLQLSYKELQKLITNEILMRQWILENSNSMHYQK